MKQRIAVGITAVAVAVGTAFIGVGTASAAATPSAACKASGTSTITPGLTFTATSHTTKLAGKLANCTGSGGVKSGTFSGTLKSASTSCTSLSKPGAVVGKGTLTIKWNTAKTSTVTATLTAGKATVTSTTITARFTLTGKVSKGQFAGKSLSGQFSGKIPVQSGLCTTKPVSKISFTGTSKVS